MSLQGFSSACRIQLPQQQPGREQAALPAAQAAAAAAQLLGEKAASSPAFGLRGSDASSSPSQDRPAVLACCQSAVEQPG